MSTNPAGKGTKTIGINMSKEMAHELEKRASSLKISTGKYCKIILSEWLNNADKSQTGIPLEIWLPEDTPDWISTEIEAKAQELMSAMGYRVLSESGEKKGAFA